MSKLNGKAKAKKRKREQSKRSIEKARYMKQYLTKIVKYDNPILSQECEKISLEEIKGISDELITVLSATKNGVGISAPQIGHTKRIFVMRPDKKENHFIICANPEIVKDNFVEFTDIEGCLSYPNVKAKVKRPWKIEVRYTDQFGNKKERELLGLRARIFLHENDHLNGICLVGQKWEEEQKERFSKKDQEESS